MQTISSPAHNNSNSKNSLNCLHMQLSPAQPEKYAYKNHEFVNPKNSVKHVNEINNSFAIQHGFKAMDIKMHMGKISDLIFRYIWLF